MFRSDHISESAQSDIFQENRITTNEWMVDLGASGPT